ncbi:hypothetical protein Tco_0633016, partial [Tanacetum coccineum]
NVKAGLATLGLFDEDDPSLSSFNIIKSSLVKVKYFSPIWKVLMQYIVKCVGGMHGSHDQLNANQQGTKKERNQMSVIPDICLLHGTSENEKALTSHMCSMAELSPEPIHSLVPSSEEVNADDTADKSLSRTSAPLVTQPKAQTAKKPRKKKNPSSTQLN